LDDGSGRRTTIRRLAMSKRFKMWALSAALVGGALLGGGCGFSFGGLSTTTILAILQEELFG
jgi:ribose/xylose/arabinose/galactoside ABC-type transport system permease subunit